MRVFTSEQELSYLAAFSNSVMAEVARLDTKLADTAKADFISSISHELRSPLHGILGMTDLLKDTQLDSQQDSHVQTIETCGKTLLDTINHVLDYAKINNLTRGSSTSSSKRRTKRAKSAKMISPAGGHTNDIMTIVSDVDLCVLAEEALDSVFAGFRFQQSASLDKSYEQPDAPTVSVVVDINKSDNFVFRTQPGAWRRVIMNLFGNALKYTPAGYIKIKLQVFPNSDPNDDCAELRLTVADSGIGMSENYINNRLFHSFAQENPLSQGTGLGLSIVKQLVELLGGDVEVRSERGHGTKFTVSCPMKRSAISPTPSPAGNLSLPDRMVVDVRQRTQNLNVHFVGFDDEEEYFPAQNFKSKNASALMKKAVDSLCVDWFGMKTWKYGTADAPAPDVFMATEAGARYLRSQYSQHPEKLPTAPVVVVCRGAASAQSTTAITIPGLVFECTAQPCGPHKLAKALFSCLNRHANRMTDTPITSMISQLNLKENYSPPNKRISELTEHTRPTITSTFSAPEISTYNKNTAKRAAPSFALNCLAVDDNPINLRLLKTFVQKLGHHHVLAKTGLEALNAYKSNTMSLSPTSDTASSLVPVPHGNASPSIVSPARIDVILMDINMPEMDGLEATRQIRAHERDQGLSPTTIIALTGVASTDAQQEAHASGVNLFLVKPVRLAELDVILKSVIKGDEHTKQAEKTDNRVVEDAKATTKETDGGAEAPADFPKERCMAEEHARELGLINSPR
jgi:signal transduction histidine kinase/CheY-like chemotaxis protein